MSETMRCKRCETRTRKLAELKAQKKVSRETILDQRVYDRWLKFKRAYHLSSQQAIEALLTYIGFDGTNELDILHGPLYCHECKAYFRASHELLHHSLMHVKMEQAEKTRSVDVNIHIDTEKNRGKKSAI